MVALKLYKYWDVVCALCIVICLLLLLSGCQTQDLTSSTQTTFLTPTVISTLDISISINPPTSTSSKLVPGWCPLLTLPPVKSKIRMAYVNFGDRTDVWVWNEGADPVQLTDFGDVDNVSISEDGEIIVFTRWITENQSELWSVHVDGSRVQRVISAENFAFKTIEWINNSHSFTFHKQSADLKDNGSINEIWIVDVDSGTNKYLGSGDFIFSPDGKYIAIYGESGIDLYTANGNLYKTDVLLGYRMINENGLNVFIQPSWSQDSLSLLVVKPETNDVYRSDATFSIYQVDVVSDESVSLGTYLGFALDVNFSPDHKFMFYQRDSSLRPSELHLVNLQTNENIVYIKEDAVEFGEWSPNSQGFIFYVIYDIRVGNVCLNNEEARQLPYHTGSTFIDWVDNTTYIIKERVDTSWEVFFENLDALENKSTSFSVYDYDVVTVPYP